jgi:hypothetical protein
MIESWCATFWLIVACGSAGSGVPWRPWDNCSRYGWWMHGLASFYLRTSCVRCALFKKSRQCGVQHFAYVGLHRNWYKKTLWRAFCTRNSEPPRIRLAPSSWIRRFNQKCYMAWDWRAHVEHSWMLEQVRATNIDQDRDLFACINATADKCTDKLVCLEVYTCITPKIKLWCNISNS